MSHSKQREQLELGIRERVGWGGRRAGAGRKPGANPRVRHGSRTGVAARFPCNVTLKMRDDVPSLRSVRLRGELES